MTRIRTFGIRAAAVLASGVMLALALPDANVWPLAFVAHVPLLLLVPTLSRRGAWLAGWAAGFVAQAGIYLWIVHTAVTMSDFPLPAAVGVLAAYALWVGLATGLLALAARVLMDRPLAVLTVPAAGVAVEFLFPQLFPWHLGNVFFRVPVLLQGMEATGVYGASFVALATATGIARAIRSGRPAILRDLAPALLILAAWSGFGAWRFADVRDAPADASVRLALVQPDITAEDKKRKDAASRKALFDRLTGLTRSADLSRVDAIVWPEGAFPFYFDPFAEGRKGWTNIVETSKRMVAFVREIGRPVVFGTLTQPAGRSRNSVMHLSADGVEAGRYDKMVLLAFGEYMPLSQHLPFLKGKVKEIADMEAGVRPVTFRLGAADALVSVCYEAILPSFTRRVMNETGANLILNLTNDAWFGERGAPAQHLMVQVPRAVEHRVPLVRQTETGISVVVSPAGEISLETGIHERRVDVVDIAVRPASPTVYAVIGDSFAWACVAGLIAALAAAYFRGKKSRSTSTG